MQVPDLSLIIVSFQVCELLERCLASLARFATDSQLEIIVVDNASSDGSAEMVRRKYPQIVLLENRENVGFSKANNQGFKIAEGRYWMLLNPDTEIAAADANPFEILISLMDQQPQAGVCGASLFYADGSRQHSAFGFPTLAQIYMDLFPVNWRLKESRLNGRYPFSLYARGKPFQIDHPLGAALMVRPGVAAQVGFLDEDYFIFAEEVDWCIRIKQAGWQVWCVPAARIIHHEARSTRQFRGRMFVELWQARFILFRKHYSRAFNWAARRLVRQGMSEAIRAVNLRAERGEITEKEAEENLVAYQKVLELANS